LIKSSDVLHSFFLPNVRMKQDVVPGMAQNMWFKAKETGEFDIVCAELCGWGHYKMKGRVTFQPRQDYEEWLKQMYDDQEAKTVAMTPEE
jgi:cytochrome c oxidase subunit 2